MTNVLVTGANGFIGNVLCKHLAKKHEVIGSIRKERKPGLSHPNIRIVHTETIGPNTNWKNILVGVNVVIHLAARVHILSRTTPNQLNEYRLVNRDGSRNLAMQAAQYGIKRFIFLSSIGVHGSQTTLTQRFNENSPICPETPYTLSKWEAEEELLKIAENTGMELIIIRAPLTYGPNPVGNFKSLIKIIKMGVPLPISCIKNKRSFLYIGNLIEALLECIDNPVIKNEVFLLSDNEDISIPELIHLLAKRFNKSPILFPIPLPILELASNLLRKSHQLKQLSSNLLIDNKKARTFMNTYPKYSLKEGFQLSFPSITKN